jgi:hypothetical protein
MSTSVTPFIVYNKSTFTEPLFDAQFKLVPYTHEYVDDGLTLTLPVQNLNPSDLNVQVVKRGVIKVSALNKGAEIRSNVALHDSYNFSSFGVTFENSTIKFKFAKLSTGPTSVPVQVV